MSDLRLYRVMRDLEGKHCGNEYLGNLVVCGECKHRKPSGYVGSVKTYECDITGLRMHDLTNHFCSYGEREGE